MNVDLQFKELLQEHGLDKCKNCEKEIDRGDVAWNNGSTEAGTGYSVLEIQCQACDTEVLMVHSWYPWIDNFEEFVCELERELERGK